MRASACLTKSRETKTVINNQVLSFAVGHTSSISLGNRSDRLVSTDQYAWLAGSRVGTYHNKYNDSRASEDRRIIIAQAKHSWNLHPVNSLITALPENIDLRRRYSVAHVPRGVVCRAGLSRHRCIQYTLPEGTVEPSNLGRVLWESALRWRRRFSGRILLLG